MFTSHLIIRPGTRNNAMFFNNAANVFLYVYTIQISFPIESKNNICFEIYSHQIIT